jgi:hypothetical protein
MRLSGPLTAAAVTDDDGGANDAPAVFGQQPQTALGPRCALRKKPLLVAEDLARAFEDRRCR